MNQTFAPERKVSWNVRKHGDRFDVQVETPMMMNDEMILKYNNYKYNK